MAEKRKNYVKHLGVTARFGIAFMLIGLAFLLSFLLLADTEIGASFSGVSIGIEKGGIDQALTHAALISTIVALALLVAYLAEARTSIRITTFLFAIIAFGLFWVADLESMKNAFESTDISIVQIMNGDTLVPANYETLDNIVYYSTLTSLVLILLGAILLLFGKAAKADFVAEKSLSTDHKFGRISLWSLALFIAFLFVQFMNSGLILFAEVDETIVNKESIITQFTIISVFLVLALWLISNPRVWLKRMVASLMIIVGIISITAEASTNTESNIIQYLTLQGTATATVFIVAGTLTLFGKIRPIHVAGKLSKAEKEIEDNRKKLEKEAKAKQAELDKEAKAAAKAAAAVVVTQAVASPEPIVQQVVSQAQVVQHVQPNVIYTQPQTIIIQQPVNPEQVVVYKPAKAEEITASDLKVVAELKEEIEDAELDDIVEAIAENEEAAEAVQEAIEEAIERVEISDEDAALDALLESID